MNKKIISLALIGILSVSMIGCSSSNKNSNNVEKTKETAVSRSTPQPNTSEMVDHIINEARSFVESNEGNDEHMKLCEEATDFAAQNIDNLHKDNETMEKTIYYGAILEKTFGDLMQKSSHQFEDSDKKNKREAYYNLGTDMIQSVKYVYRDVEKIEDESTKSNIKQIKDSLLVLHN